MLPSERFAEGTRVRYVGDEDPAQRGELAVVIRAPRLQVRVENGRELWIGMRVWFDGDRDTVMGWPDQFEPLSAIELLADLNPPPRKRIKASGRGDCRRR
jgi:hypothetical protein